MQSKTAVHQACQHADFGGTKHFAGKFRRAVATLQPAQRTPLFTTGAVGPFTRSSSKTGTTVVGTPQLHQHGLGALPQQFHIDARRHCKQHVAQLHPLTLAVQGGMGVVMALAGFFRRVGHT